MGLRQRIVDRGRQALARPAVMRWVTNDRVMRAAEGVMDARDRVKAAWGILVNGHELPSVDPAIDDSICHHWTGVGSGPRPSFFCP